jgi:hypothetical protein
MGIVKNAGAQAFRDYITDGVPSSGKKKVSKADVRRAFDLIEKFAQIKAVSITTTAQPGSPADGALYILPSGKSGAQWASYAVGSLALYETGRGWSEVVPIEGWSAFVVDTQRRYEWKAGAWSWTDPLATGALDDDVNLAANSDDKIATQKAVKAYADQKIALTALDDDATLAADSDNKIATQKAVKAYADTKIALSAIDTDGALSANSDVKLASQKAVKTYVDALLAANDAQVYKGAIDCSANPNYPAASAGHTYRVSVAGKIGGGSGPNVQAGDILLCFVDSTAAGNHATVGASWDIVQTNIDGAVVGPSSATDGHIARFDGVTGKLLKSGLVLDTDGALAANANDRVPAQSAVRVIVDAHGLWPEQFGAVGNGTTDDTTALTNWINAVMATQQRRGKLRCRPYALSAALPRINVPGVSIIAPGSSHSHNVGTMVVGAELRAITNTGFDMLTVAPDSGASAQWLDGFHIAGVAFNCAQKAARGVVAKSLRRSIIDVGCFEALTVGMELGIIATLGEANSFTRNWIRYVGRQQAANAPALLLSGGTLGNPCFNVFEGVDIVHHDAIGIVVENADNNVWLDTRVSHTGLGAALYSIEWRGGPDATHSCRAERYISLSTTLPAVARGTEGGTYAMPAKNIFIDNLDKDNNTPLPVEGTGASIIHPEWRTYTPALTNSGGALTSATAAGYWRRLRNEIQYQHDIAIATNGAGGGALFATLPVTSHAVNYGIGGFKELAVVGKSGAGVIGGSATLVAMQFADGGYPGGNGHAIRGSGSYRWA